MIKKKIDILANKNNSGFPAPLHPFLLIGINVVQARSRVVQVKSNPPGPVFCLHTNCLYAVVQVVQVNLNINTHARARVVVFFLLLFYFIKKYLDHLDQTNKTKYSRLDQPPGPTWTNMDQTIKTTGYV